MFSLSKYVKLFKLKIKKTNITQFSVHFAWWSMDVAVDLWKKYIFGSNAYWAALMSIDLNFWQGATPILMLYVVRFKQELLFNWTGHNVPWNLGVFSHKILWHRKYRDRGNYSRNKIFSQLFWLWRNGNIKQRHQDIKTTTSVACLNWMNS